MGRKNHPHRTKTLYIFRGLPGTLKTDRARALQRMFGGEIISADDYFRNELGKIEKIIPKELHRAHMLAREKCVQAMDDGVDPVIIDNTNMAFWEMYPYILMGFHRGYWIKFKIMKDTWRLSLEDLYRNNGNIPLSTLEYMKSQYQPVRHIYNILNDNYSKRKWESSSEMEDGNW